VTVPRRFEGLDGQALRVLVVEDDPGIAEALRVLLTRSGYEPLVVSSGPAGWQVLTRERPAAVLLDLSLPGLDGAELLQRLREGGNPIPVVVVTANTSSANLVRILELGADDYVVKPFRGPEVVARLRASLRRAGSDPVQAEPALLSRGGLQLDLHAGAASVTGTPVFLSPTEFRLLQVLLEHANEMRAGAALMSDIWGSDSEVDRSILRVNVYRLRRKLDTAGTGWGHIRGSADGRWGLFLPDSPHAPKPT
jgi:DNA-binding response OmpR family regulator